MNGLYRDGILFTWEEVIGQAEARQSSVELRRSPLCPAATKSANTKAPASRVMPSEVLKQCTYRVCQAPDSSAASDTRSFNSLLQKGQLSAVEHLDLLGNTSKSCCEKDRLVTYPLMHQASAHDRPQVNPYMSGFETFMQL